MPSRIFPFANGYFYHVYNRGNEKRLIFSSRRDYQRFIKTLNYYQHSGPKPKFSNFSQFQTFRPDPSKKIVDIVSYCLMPNHFHLLLRQSVDGGITEFVGKISNSYTKYYNAKYNRIGHLLQGEFKSVLIEKDEQLIHLSRYIHLNPRVSLLVKDLESYEWSSYKEYLGEVDGFCAKQEILGFFKNPQDYRQYILDQVDYGERLEQIKHQVLEEI
ncbi:transposase [Candidatus Daviesbacteria bacterium]|nr:transposase [Candidatus Daviesbacteria bacterium]